MSITDPSASHDARAIGNDSQDIQKDVLLAAVRFLDALMKKLRRLKLLRKNAPPPVISISLGNKALSRENSPTNGQTLATSLSEADLEYIDRAMKTPESREQHSDLDRDLTIAVNGRDVLVVRNGVVQKNSLYEREAERDYGAKNTVQTSHGNTRGDGPKEEFSASSPSAAYPSPPTGEAKEEILEAEVVTDVLDREPQERYEAESPVESPVIVILTREIQRRAPPSKERQAFTSFLRSIGAAPKNVAKSIGSTFSEARDTLLRHLSRDRNPLNRTIRELSALTVAHELLDRFGQRSGAREVFEGNLYSIERQPRESLTITAKDGRGVVFSQREGVIYENFSPVDYHRFARIGERLSGHSIHVQQRQEYERD